MGTGNFEALPLHDALLRSVDVDWQEKRCTFQVLAFAKPRSDGTAHVLVFEGVTFLSMTRNEPWGPSSHVNCVSSVGPRFRLEMQSGDIIELTAASFAFRAL